MKIRMRCDDVVAGNRDGDGEVEWVGWGITRGWEGAVEGAVGAGGDVDGKGRYSK